MTDVPTWLQAIMNQWGEFTGTMILILIGNGVCFSVSHAKMFANQPGKWAVISLGWGLAVFMGATVAWSIGNTNHINPAVSIWAAINELRPAILGYIPFQILGAMTGQLVLNFINWKFIMATAAIDPAATKSAHCTGPAFSNKEDRATIYNFAYEWVGTMVLISVILTLGRGNNANLATSSSQLWGPLPATLIVMGIGMALGSSTGYAINPARDLGPRLVYTMMRPLMMRKSGAELAKADWSYAWIPVVAPLTAGLLVGGFSWINHPPI